MRNRLGWGMLLALQAQLAWGQFAGLPMIGTMPGMAQMQAIDTQRHQARTLLYREALEELKKNPRAADVKPCAEAGASPDLCLPAAALPAAEPVAPTIKRKRALLVGNNAYAKPIPPLETPIFDVEKIGELLQRQFGYEVEILRDASKAQILGSVKRLAEETDQDASVLVMYAGHGYLVDETKMGFWIPVDGSVKTAANWISNTDIGKFLAAFNARQVILISDSCFSGSLVREQKMAANQSGNREDWLRQRSVLVLSSGGEEPVSDEGKDGHSIFAWSLLDTLSKVDRYAPGFQVYRVVKDQVSKDYPQEPQYGAVLSAGHVGGDYLLEPVGPR